MFGMFGCLGIVCPNGAADRLEQVPEQDALVPQGSDCLVHGVELGQDAEPIATLGCFLERQLDLVSKVFP